MGKSMTVECDDDDEDDEDDTSDDVFFDCFANIKQKLEDDDRLFIRKPFDQKDRSGDVVSRLFDTQFKEFKKGMEGKYGGKMKQYPRKFRFCSVVDKRLPDCGAGGVIDGDELIFFEPTKETAIIPPGKHVPLVYFETSKACLIPAAKGYVEPKGAQAADTGAKDKLTKEPITSQSPCKGAMMLLSFHVESTDVMRCYLYVNGQCIRFMPEDVIMLLPTLFDGKVPGNKGWAKAEHAKRLVEVMRTQLRDVQFGAFMKKNRTELPWSRENGK